VAGAGDQAAGAIGMGIVSPGKVSATIGTSEWFFAATARPALDPKGRLHTFCHALPERWFVMGGDPGGGTFSSLVPGSVRLRNQRSQRFLREAHR